MVETRDQAGLGWGAIYSWSDGSLLRASRELGFHRAAKSSHGRVSPEEGGEESCVLGRSLHWEEQWGLGAQAEKWPLTRCSGQLSLGPLPSRR